LFNGKRIKMIDCTKFASSILTENNELYTWGLAKSGTLGKKFEV